MNIASILKKQINKEQIYKNIVKSSHKNDIIKLGLPFGIIILGVTLYLLKKKGMKENDWKTST